MKTLVVRCLHRRLFNLFSVAGLESLGESNVAVCAGWPLNAWAAWAPWGCNGWRPCLSGVAMMTTGECWMLSGLWCYWCCGWCFFCSLYVFFVFSLGCYVGVNFEWCHTKVPLVVNSNIIHELLADTSTSIFESALCMEPSISSFAIMACRTNRAKYQTTRNRS